MGRKYLTRQEILDADDIQTEELHIPEWPGGWICLRGLSGLERDKLESMNVKRNGANVEVNMENHRARTVAMCMVDAEGNRIFGDDDVEALGNKSGAALSRAYAVAARLSGMTTEDALENARAFVKGQSDDSGSGSPGN